MSSQNRRDARRRRSPAWTVELVRRGGRGRRHRRDRRPRTSSAGPARARCSSTGPTRVGPPTPAPASSRPRPPSATTRPGSSSCSPRVATTTRSSRPLGPETGWARCGILQLATRETDLSAWEWVAERATGATEISPDDARAMVPVLGKVIRALHHPRGRPGRRPDDVRGAAARADRAGRGGAARLGRRGPGGEPGGGRDRRRRGPGTGGRDRGWGVDPPPRRAARRAASRRPGTRPDRASRRGRPRHGELADRATGLRPLHGAVGRSPRRGRRDGRGRRVRTGRDRRRRATRSCARRCA